jgi:hypothetical protein
VRIKEEIEKGNSLPELVHVELIKKALADSGCVEGECVCACVFK